MRIEDEKQLKRIALGCVAALLLLIGLIVVAFQTGLIKVDISSGGGEDSSN